MRNIAKLLVLAAGFSAIPLTGQSSNLNEKQDAIDGIRDRGRSSYAADLLSKERGNLSQSELDALADDLVAVAVAFTENGSPKEARAAAAALRALSASGRAGRATPYSGAFDSIRRIFEGSPEIGVRAGALTNMTRLPNVGRAVAYMVGMTTSNEYWALPAVEHLGQDLGAPGVAALKRLYKADTVVFNPARRFVEWYAASNGW